jgi:hypothetical protein
LNTTLTRRDVETERMDVLLKNVAPTELLCHRDADQHQERPGKERTEKQKRRTVSASVWSDHVNHLRNRGLEFNLLHHTAASDGDRNCFTRPSRSKNFPQQLCCSFQWLSAEGAEFITNAQASGGESAPKAAEGSETERQHFLLAIAGENPPPARAVEDPNLCARGMLERVCQQHVNHRSRQECSPI